MSEIPRYNIKHLLINMQRPLKKLKLKTETNSTDTALAIIPHRKGDWNSFTICTNEDHPGKRGQQADFSHWYPMRERSEGNARTIAMEMIV
jgi:hypothetical protein